MTCQLKSRLKTAMSYFRPGTPERNPSERRTLLRLLLQLCLLVALGFDIIDYDVDFSVSEDTPALMTRAGLLDARIDRSGDFAGIPADSVIPSSHVISFPSDRAPPA